MSAIFARILLTVGIGVASALIYTFWRDNHQEQHSHHQGPRRPAGADAFGGGNWEAPPSWRDEDSDEDDSERRRRRMRTISETSTKSAASAASSSIQKGCFICLEAFEYLKRKNISIMTTPCGHLFCNPCLERALNGNPACPSCRKRVNFGNCHKIHL